MGFRQRMVQCFVSHKRVLHSCWVIVLLCINQWLIMHCNTSSYRSKLWAPRLIRSAALMSAWLPSWVHNSRRQRSQRCRPKPVIHQFISWKSFHCQEHKHKRDCGRINLKSPRAESVNLCEIYYSALLMLEDYQALDHILIIDAKLWNETCRESKAETYTKHYSVLLKGHWSHF